jgi:hypothetical protein
MHLRREILKLTIFIKQRLHQTARVLEAEIAKNFGMNDTNDPYAISVVDNVCSTQLFKKRWI